MSLYRNSVISQVPINFRHANELRRTSITAVSDPGKGCLTLFIPVTGQASNLALRCRLIACLSCQIVMFQGRGCEKQVELLNDAARDLCPSVRREEP